MTLKPTPGTAHHGTSTINLGGNKTEVASITIDGKVIAMTASAASPRFEQAKVDAKFIAVAWNNFDALVASIQEQHGAIDKLMQGIKALDPNFDPAQHPAWQAALQAHQTLEAINEAIAA